MYSMFYIFLIDIAEFSQEVIAVNRAIVTLLRRIFAIPVLCLNSEHTCSRGRWGDRRTHLRPGPDKRPLPAAGIGGGDGQGSGEVSRSMERINKTSLNFV